MIKNKNTRNEVVRTCFSWCHILTRQFDLSGTVGNLDAKIGKNF